MSVLLAQYRALRCQYCSLSTALCDVSTVRSVPHFAISVLLAQYRTPLVQCEVSASSVPDCGSPGLNSAGPVPESA
eukprot:404605-Rhodomonas_salina.2